MLRGEICERSDPTRLYPARPAAVDTAPAPGYIYCIRLYTEVYASMRSFRRMFIRHAADALTLLRVVLSAALLFSAPFSVSFYIIYLLCGASDIADGAAARATGTASERGARLDSLADAVFALVCAVRILPELRLGAVVWGFVSIVMLFRIFSMMSGLVKHRRLIFLHTFANRLAGTSVFLALPAIVLAKGCGAGGIASVLIAVTVAAALFASVQELVLILRGRTE